MFTKRTLKVFLIAIVAFSFATVAYASAAANDVPPTNAGDGAKTISGYTVSAVKYNLNASNPGNIDSVTFTTDVTVPTGSTVKIKLVASGTDWYTCTGQDSKSISCTTTSPQATVLAANDLRVVIAN